MDNNANNNQQQTNGDVQNAQQNQQQSNPQDNNQQQNNQQQNQAQNNSTSTAGDGAKVYTQAEIDALIEKRLARERKKYQQNPAPVQQPQTQAQQPDANTQPTSVEVDVTEDARQQAAAIIAKANQRLIQSIAQAEATKLNINPDYIADAVRLADLSKVTVSDDGTVDTKSITAALEAVLTRMPVLKASTEAPAGGFKIGGQGGTNPQQTNTWGGNQSTNAGERKRWNKNRY